MEAIRTEHWMENLSQLTMKIGLVTTVPHVKRVMAPSGTPPAQMLIPMVYMSSRDQLTWDMLELYIISGWDLNL